MVRSGAPSKTGGCHTKKISNLVGLTWEGLSALTIPPDILDQMTGPGAAIAAGRDQGKLAQTEIDRDFGTLHGVALLGLWGVFESYIGDIFKGTLATDKALLDGPKFKKVQVPLALSFASKDDLYQHLLDYGRTIKDRDAADQNGAIGAQESLLRLVNLHGDVPAKVANRITEAYHIRNVWAHRGGRADKKLLDRVPDLDVAIGQQVHLDRARFELLINAMNIYTVIVFNRFCLAYQLRPIAMDLPGYEGVLAELFPTALGLAPDTSPSDLSGAPE